ncbi:MAG: hypothetical protein H6606_07240 [Flavobacteriales bacterium]|nr:hypothetical protein [Flavobacteriales bacterium]
MVNTLVLLMLFVYLASCSTTPTGSSEEKEDRGSMMESAYDSLLADSLGADNWGMRSYVMALLKNGPVRDQDSAESARLMRAHLDNINRLAEEGKLVLAGPFMGDSGELRGIYLFATEDTMEARRWTNSDPSIQAGRLKMELLPWYGSAALPLLHSVHKRISKESI